MNTIYAKEIVMKSGGTIYWGDKTTEGTWKEVRSGNDILIYRLESGVWVEKGGWSA